jgi:hypothetical protein
MANFSDASSESQPKKADRKCMHSGCLMAKLSAASCESQPKIADRECVVYV